MVVKISKKKKELCSCFQRVSERVSTRFVNTWESRNYCTKSRESYTSIGSINFENKTGEIIEGTWLQEVSSTNVADLQRAAPCRTSIIAEEVLNKLKLHFKWQGQIPFQWRALNK